MQIQTRWIKNLSFEGIADEHRISIDASIAAGGDNTGMNPKRLLLCSPCACSGIDVVLILQKMKVPFTLLEIVAEAEQTAEDPKVFTHVHLTYITDASLQFEDKFRRAVELSQDKYCGISIMLKKHCPVNFTIIHK